MREIIFNVKRLIVLLLFIPQLLFSQVSGTIQITGTVQNVLELSTTTTEYNLNLNGAEKDQIVSLLLKSNKSGNAIIVLSTQNNFTLKSAQENPDEWKYSLILVDETGTSYSITESSEIILPFLKKGGKFDLFISYPSALQLNLFQGMYTDNLIITFKLN